jgi:hypothetical protein
MHEKLDISDVFKTIFATYKDQAALLLPAALIVYLPVAIVNAIIGSTDAAVGAILVLVSFAITLIASFYYQGMVVQAARDMQDGVRDFDLGSLFRSVTPVLGALIAAGLLAGLGVALGFVLLIVPGLILLTWWAVVAPVVVIEHPGATTALGRSRALVRGNGWQVFGVIVLLVILQALLSAIIGALLGGAGGSGIAAAIAGLIANVIVAPLSALAATVMYLRLRQIHGEPAVSGGRQATVGGPGPTAGAPVPTQPQPAPGGASAPLSSDAEPARPADSGPGSEHGREPPPRP